MKAAIGQLKLGGDQPKELKAPNTTAHIGPDNSSSVTFITESKHTGGFPQTINEILEVLLQERLSNDDVSNIQVGVSNLASAAKDLQDLS